MTIARPRTEAPRRRPPSPRLGRSGTRGARAAFLGLGPTSWYDARDLTATATPTLANRVGAGSAQLGSTSGSDTNDPVALPYDTGAAYVYLPGTASNNLSIVKGAWAGTLHVTATLTDDTTATFTTTADPVLIGNALLSAGRYKKFVVRDTDGNGTVRVTIEPSVETTGQSSWTCTTGQTVTVNRATTGLTTAVVTRPLLMADGTDDYVQLPAGDTPTFTATTGAYTALLITRIPVTPAASALRLISSESSANNGFYVRCTTASTNLAANVGGATTSVLSGAATFTVAAMSGVAYVQDTGSATVWTNTFGASASLDTTGVGTITHAPLRVAIRGYIASGAMPLEFFTLVTWNRALTTAELTAAYNYLSGTYA